MPPADHRVTLLSRTGCHLCDEARTVLDRVAAELGAGWDERDVDTDPDLLARYGDLVPVILVDGREHGHWRIEEDRLRRTLTR